MVTRPHDQQRRESIPVVATNIAWITALVLHTLIDGHYGLPQVVARLNHSSEKLVTNMEKDFANRVEHLYQSPMKILIVEELRVLTLEKIIYLLCNSSPANITGRHCA